MKVNELIKELEKQDPDAEVYTEGCDCVGDVAKVEASVEPTFGDDWEKTGEVTIVTLCRSN